MTNKEVQHMKQWNRAKQNQAAEWSSNLIEFMVFCIENVALHIIDYMKECGVMK